MEAEERERLQDDCDPHQPTGAHAQRAEGGDNAITPEDGAHDFVSD
jgi:hypothetical protein